MKLHKIEVKIISPRKIESWSWERGWGRTETELTIIFSYKNLSNYTLKLKLNKTLITCKDVLKLRL